MTWTIYTLGDLALFQSVLNGVGMIFSVNAGLFSSSSGLGLGPVIGVSFLIALVVVLASTMVSQATGGGAKNNLASLLMLVIVMTLVVGPKQTVVLEDVYSGKVAVVPNIPLGVAAPAGFISAFTRGISGKFETAFSTTGGNNISMGEQGFINPINLLASLRVASLVADENLTRTFFNTYRDCAMWRINVDTLKTSGAPLEYVLSSAASGGGFTTVYRSASSSTTRIEGDPYACNEAVNVIRSEFDRMFEAGGKDAVRFAAMSGTRLPEAHVAPGPAGRPGYTGTSTGRAPTNDDLLNALALLPGGAAANNQNAINLFAAPLIQTAAKCANSSVDVRTYQQCAGIMIEDASRIFTAQSAGEAAMFTKMVVPAMNLLLAMFFAFSPIVVMAAATSSGYGTSMLVKYFFFGIWTQSWMPMATIINYLIQVDAAGDIQTIVSSYGSINMANAPDIFNALQRKLAVGFNLLAATPLITMAVLSGSFFAMTSMAQRMSSGGMGQGVGDVSAIERRSFQGAPLVSAQSELSGTSTTGMLTAGGAQRMPTWDASSTIQNARSQAQQALTQFSKDGGGARAAERVSGWSQQTAQQAHDSIKEYLDKGSSSEMRDAFSGLVKFNEQRGMSAEEARGAAGKQIFQTMFGGEAGFKVGAGGDFGFVKAQGSLGGSFKANSATSGEATVARKNADGSSSAASIEDARNMASSVANALKTGIGTENGRTMTNSVANKLDATDKESFTASTKFLEAHSETLANTNNATDASGTKVSLPMSTLAKKMQSRGDNQAENTVKGMGERYESQMNMMAAGLVNDVGGDANLAKKIAALSVLQQNSGNNDALKTVNRINSEYLGMNSTPSQSVKPLDQGAHAAAMTQGSEISARAEGMRQQGPVALGSAKPPEESNIPATPKLALTPQQAGRVRAPLTMPVAQALANPQVSALQQQHGANVDRLKKMPGYGSQPAPINADELALARGNMKPTAVVMDTGRQVTDTVDAVAGVVGLKPEISNKVFGAIKPK